MKNTLTRFAKDECCNYDKHYQTCLDGEPCKVLSGARCGYFEKVVLGPVDYKFRLSGYDYQKLFAQYAEQTGTEGQAVQQHRCVCGNPLRLRQRFCDDCSRKKRQDSNRRYNRKRAG